VPRSIPAFLFVGVALVYLLTISSNPSPDVYSADFAAGHIARTGDPVPDISDFPALDDNIIRETWIVETADGREAVGRAPGVIAASVPAYWLLGPDGVTAIPGGIAAALLTAGTVTLLFFTLQRRIRTRHALLASLLFGLTTPVWSVAADGMWPHTLTCFGIIGMAWAADQPPKRARGADGDSEAAGQSEASHCERGQSAQWWWLVGLFGGVALWGRLHAALLCSVVAVAVALVRRQPAIVARVGIVSGAMLGLMSLWTHWMYGTWDPSSGYRAGDFTGNAVSNAADIGNFLGFWIAPDRGLLVWTPLIVVLAPALVRGWKELPDWSRALLWAGVAYLLVQGLLVRFSGGDQFYGYRTSLELLACATPALALSAHHMGRLARRAFVPVAVLQLVMITPGAVVDGFYLKVAHVWHRNAFVWGPLDRPLLWGLLVAAALGAAALFTLGWNRTDKAGTTKARPL
jgi:hypothetical protein